MVVICGLVHDVHTVFLLPKTTNSNIFRPTCTMEDSFKVHFSCFCWLFCFVVVICDLVHDVQTVFIMPYNNH